MSSERRNKTTDGAPLVLVAINDDELWQELSGELEKRFRVRRETDGLRAIDVAMLLRPVAVIAETGLPGLSGILLARLIGHSRHLARLPVALIMSRQYLIEEFWAKGSGAIAAVSRKDAKKAIESIVDALGRTEPIPAEDWDAAEAVIREHGGPAAGVASELENQLIGATILARLGDIEITGAPSGRAAQETIPAFIHQALSALSSVLEFSQVGIAIFESGELYIIENEKFKDVIDREWFFRETQSSMKLYNEPGHPLTSLEAVYLSPVSLELPGPREPASTYFALPLNGRQGTYGLLSIMTYKQIAVREYYLQTLSLIGAQLAVTLERALFYEEVRRLSVTDHLTGLSNRRALLARLEEEFRRSTRYHSPLSVAILDLDDFKEINDQHGHYAGDAILRDVAEIIRGVVREVDLAGRWGGEEMALLFPQTPLEGATVACERVRKEVEQHITEFQTLKLNVTLSVGIATLNPDTISPRSSEALIALADSAMYLAKSRGKNQVAHFKELPDAPCDGSTPASLELKPVQVVL